MSYSVFYAWILSTNKLRGPHSQNTYILFLFLRDLTLWFFSRVHLLSEIFLGQMPQFMRIRLIRAAQSPEDTYGSPTSQCSTAFWAVEGKRAPLPATHGVTSSLFQNTSHSIMTCGHLKQRRTEVTGVSLFRFVCLPQQSRDQESIKLNLFSVVWEMKFKQKS